MYSYYLPLHVAGEFPKELHQQKMGPLNHSRWFTTASRILRLYVSCTCDIPLLTRFTNYIVNIYFKVRLLFPNAILQCSLCSELSNEFCFGVAHNVKRRHKDCVQFRSYVNGNMKFLMNSTWPLIR